MECYISSAITLQNRCQSVGGDSVRIGGGDDIFKGLCSGLHCYNKELHNGLFLLLNNGQANSLDVCNI